MSKKFLTCLALIFLLCYCNNKPSEKNNKSQDFSYLKGIWKEHVKLNPETEEEKEKRLKDEFDHPLVHNHSDTYIVFEEGDGIVSVYRRNTIEKENEWGDKIKTSDNKISFSINGFVKTIDKYQLTRDGDKLRGTVQRSGGDSNEVSFTKMNDDFKIPYEERSY